MKLKLGLSKECLIGITWGQTTPNCEHLGLQGQTRCGSNEIAPRNRVHGRSRAVEDIRGERRASTVLCLFIVAY